MLQVVLKSKLYSWTCASQEAPASQELAVLDQINKAALPVSHGYQPLGSSSARNDPWGGKQVKGTNLLT